MNPDGVAFNPLGEPSPIGLTLKKSPSFLDLIQMKLSQQNTSNTMLSKKPCSVAADKLKASNFPASFLKIGNWEVCHLISFLLLFEYLVFLNSDFFSSC